MKISHDSLFAHRQLFGNTIHATLVWALLKNRHAENTNLHHKRFCNSHRLHHHGEGEKAHLASAKKRGALGVASFNISKFLAVCESSPPVSFFYAPGLKAMMLKGGRVNSAE
ncbi:MAG TPA: hypothetical protein VFB72_11760 [Verrucomicrobiae bacterium]|nr:hypothetical protein [Verrucomicrobiae bacterium]